MRRFADRYTNHTDARLRALDNGDRAARLRRQRALAAVAAEAERAARRATADLLGAAVAEASVWEGHPDGTATGTADGLPFRWTPWPLDGAHLLLLRSCRRCGARWPAPVRSVGQLIGALVEPHCGPARVGGPHPPVHPVEGLAG